VYAIRGRVEGVERWWTRTGKSMVSVTEHPHDLVPDACEIARLNEEIVRLGVERNNWIETAQQHLRNEQYYRGLVDQCGKAIGKDAYTCDDGTTQQDVLCAKVPDLVRKLSEKREETADLICDIMRDEVNVIATPPPYARPISCRYLMDSYSWAENQTSTKRNRSLPTISTNAPTDGMKGLTPICL
jgi:hypothetical protein